MKQILLTILLTVALLFPVAAHVNRPVDVRPNKGILLPNTNGHHGPDRRSFVMKEKTLMAPGVKGKPGTFDADHALLKQAFNNAGSRLMGKAPRRMSASDVEGEKIMLMMGYEYNSDSGKVVLSDHYLQGGWNATVTEESPGVLKASYMYYYLPVTINVDYGAMTAEMEMGTLATFQWSNAVGSTQYDTTQVVMIVNEDYILNPNSGLINIQGKLNDEGSLFFADGYCYYIIDYCTKTQNGDVTCDTIAYRTSVYRDTYLMTPNGKHQYDSDYPLFNENGIYIDQDSICAEENDVYMYQADDTTAVIWNMWGLANRGMVMYIHEDGIMEFPSKQVAVTSDTDWWEQNHPDEMISNELYNYAVDLPPEEVSADVFDYLREGSSFGAVTPTEITWGANALLEETCSVGEDTWYPSACLIPYYLQNKLTFTDGSQWFAKQEEPIDSIIYFVDDKVKALCVQNWDTSGDSELSYREAAAVSDLGSVFRNNREITSFDELQYFTGLTTICDSAFYYCSGLTSIQLPNSITSINRYSFMGCQRLTNITIGDSVYSIGEEAFTFTGLTSINLPNSVTSIGSGAFYGCDGLTSIFIPSSVTFIGRNVCTYSSGLTEIVVDSENPVYDSRNRCNAIIETATNKLICGCKNTVIPNTVTSIGEFAFHAFEELTSILIPGSVISIQCNSFLSCSGLSSIVVENNNPIYDSRDECNAIIETNTNKLVLGCVNTVIPNTVTTIGRFAFSSCYNLKNFYLPNSVTRIESDAFTSCRGLTDVKIPNSVTYIGSYAFSSCFNLTEVTIPNSVTLIDIHAFYGCTSLTDVYCYISNPSAVTMGSEVFYLYSKDYSGRTLHVPAGTLAAYQADTKWSQYFENIVEMEPDTVLATSIELDVANAAMTQGETLQLTATVLPEDATDKSVTWASSDETVAIVSEDGLLTAVMPGTATITVTTNDGSQLSASCEVTVSTPVTVPDNYLSMTDTAAFHGQTIVIPVKMTNADDIISFQTDVFLPQGLELVKEDGEYVIDPSSRMTRTHSIMSNDVSNGAVRVLCYSSNYKAFTGNSGDDLFYITLKVADDAEGDYTIQLRNTLLTNSAFDELAAPDVTAIVNVKAYQLGDANASGTVTVTDVVVTSQYVLEMNPQPFVFEAADVNADDNITVTDVTRIAYMVLNPNALSALMRAPMMWNNGDRMSGEDVVLLPGETRTVSIALNNDMDYSAFQLDLNLPEGLTADNFRLTDRASSHAFDMNALRNGEIRALCYSPALAAIRGNEGALLTFDVTASDYVEGAINVSGIELVTTECLTVRLDGFAIPVNSATLINEIGAEHTVVSVDYFNVAGQRLEQPVGGVTLVVTTYDDGTRTVTKVIR